MDGQGRKLLINTPERKRAFFNIDARIDESYEYARVVAQDKKVEKERSDKLWEVACHNRKMLEEEAQKEGGRGQVFAVTPGDSKGARKGARTSQISVSPSKCVALSLQGQWKKIR